MVTLFLLYQKVLKDHRKQYKYYWKSIHLLSKDEAEQTAHRFSGQTQLCTAEGVPGEENCPVEAGEDCPAGQAMTKEF